MAYKVIRSAESNHDLNLIFRHLVDTCVALGDALPEAFGRAIRWIRTIEADMASLGPAPHQGTRDDSIRQGLRHVTKDRAIFYFDVEDAARIERVIAVLFGVRTTSDIWKGLGEG